MTFDVAFDLPLDHGCCVGIWIPQGDEALEALAAEVLVDDELAFARSLSALRRPSWVGGRVALRAALIRSGFVAPAILPDERGAPSLPVDLVGSISHKERMAVGLIGRANGARVGVDIEVDRLPGADIGPRVLSDEEVSAPGEREVLLRFSAKEAIYKALDPFVRRYVGFREVSVFPNADGTATVKTHLVAHEGPFAIEVRWRRWDGWILTTSRVVRAA